MSTKQAKRTTVKGGKGKKRGKRGKRGKIGEKWKKNEKKMHNSFIFEL